MASEHELAVYDQYIAHHGRAAKKIKRLGAMTAAAGVGAHALGRSSVIKNATARRVTRAAGGAGTAVGGLGYLAGSSMSKYNRGRKMIRQHLGGKPLSRDQQIKLQMINPSRSLAREHRGRPKLHKQALAAYGKDMFEDRKATGDMNMTREQLIETILGSVFEGEVIPFPGNPKSPYKLPRRVPSPPRKIGKLERLVNKTLVPKGYYPGERKD